MSAVLAPTLVRSRAGLAAVREALLLEQATRTAAGYPEGIRARLRSLVREGEDRAFVAARAADDGHGASALALYREAALLFMAARLVVDGAAPVPGAPAAEVLERFQSLRLGDPPGGTAAVEAVLARAPALLEAAPREEEIVRVHATVRWLRALCEPRGVAELRFERRLRVGLAGLAALAVLAWLVPSLVGNENLALHKPVTTSGLSPAAISSPNGLTDGVIAGAPYGIHTEVGDAPWVEVDLLGVFAINKVKLYNRGDGYFEDGLPMVLQVSQNHVDYVEVSTRTTAFGQTTPWVVAVNGRKARYVRVRGAPRKYVALSELEVFGKAGTKK